VEALWSHGVDVVAHRPQHVGLIRTDGFSNADDRLVQALRARDGDQHVRWVG
jgi:hypothetical protein